MPRAAVSLPPRVQVRVVVAAGRTRGYIRARVPHGHARGRWDDWHPAVTSERRAFLARYRPLRRALGRLTARRLTRALAQVHARRGTGSRGDP